MTNFEWFKKRINEISVEELGKVWETEEAPWCDRNCGDTEDACIICVERWATKPHKNPMPELKVGMFVKAHNEFEKSLGIIIKNIYTDDLAVAYEGGGYDPIRSVIIEAIYSTVGFSYCNKDTCIWSRD